MKIHKKFHLSSTKVQSPIIPYRHVFSSHSQRSVLSRLLSCLYVGAPPAAAGSRLAPSLSLHSWPVLGIHASCLRLRLRLRLRLPPGSSRRRPLVAWCYSTVAGDPVEGSWQCPCQCHFWVWLSCCELFVSCVSIRFFLSC